MMLVTVNGYPYPQSRLTVPVYGNPRPKSQLTVPVYAFPLRSSDTRLVANPSASGMLTPWGKVSRRRHLKMD